MIEANEPTNGTVVKQATPPKITTTQIIEDLENGINRDGIKEKYSLETWMVTQMFQHPTLKGRKAKKVRTLPFEFVDDTTKSVIETRIEETGLVMDTETNQTSIPVEVNEEAAMDAVNNTVNTIESTNNQFTQF